MNYITESLGKNLCEEITFKSKPEGVIFKVQFPGKHKLHPKLIKSDTLDDEIQELEF